MDNTEIEENIKDFLHWLKTESTTKFELTMLTIGLPINEEYDTLGDKIKEWLKTK